MAKQICGRPMASTAVRNSRVLSTLAVLQQDIFDQFAVFFNLSPCPFFNPVLRCERFIMREV